MFSGVFVFPNTPGSAFQLLRNVTSGSFLEADQQREINVPPPPYACNTALCRIINEGCDILQKIPPLLTMKNGLSEEPEQMLQAELELLNFQY